MVQLPSDPVALLESLLTAEARIAATIALAVGAFVFVLFVAPWTVRQLSGLVRRHVLGHDRVPLEPEDVSWIVPIRSAIHAAQAVVLVGFCFAILIVWGKLDLATQLAVLIGSVIPIVGRVLATVLLVVLAIFGTDVLESKLRQYAAGTDRINEHQEGVVFRVLQVTLLITVGLMALSLWNFDLSGLLIGAGFLGIVVGMAARHTLGSLIAGFVLMFSRPFELGDWVEIGDAEGIVTDITIINTRLRSFDGETVVIPNDMASNSRIVNRTDRDRLRLRLDVGIDYDADVERAEETAQEVLMELDSARRVPKPQVIPKTFGDSGVGLELRFWIDNPSARRRWRAHAAAVREIKAAFDREGIKIPYPQREVMGREETDGFRLAPTANDASDVSGAGGE